ncbi:Alpha/Beta hydrolase protein [Fennellomyces sp. T-0311]|nr:Alpha/Beta hydrolase protein [Fennellomyces sp. T-0311]
MLTRNTFLLPCYAFLACLLVASFCQGAPNLAAPLNASKFQPKSFLSVKHPDFPKHLIRLTQPDAEICDPDVKQYSGYLDTEDDKHFFFWFFESRSNPSKDPVVLWLNGGPGCSSMTGLFLELGPCQLNDYGNGTVNNPYSWNSNANIIFLDQPVNVGYSYGSGDVSDTTTAAKDVSAFLQLFFARLPEYSKLDFHIAGESYAGHYIPAIASALVDGNNNLSGNMKHINLKSLLIGNGLTDPLTQYGYYSDMACNNTYHPVLEQSVCNEMDRAHPECRDLIEHCYREPSAQTCVRASSMCNKALLGPFYELSGRSPYDIRQPCVSIDNDLCDQKLGLLQAYLNQQDVKNAVGGNVDMYLNCNIEINYMFQRAGDWMRPYVRHVPPLLDEANIKILIYAGDADFICNWFGNKAWALNLDWSDKSAMQKAKDVEWGKVGQLRKSPGGRFAFLRVYEAGHMVPKDQPANSLEFFNGWIHGGL